MHFASLFNQLVFVTSAVTVLKLNSKLEYEMSFKSMKVEKKGNSRTSYTHLGKKRIRSITR